MRNQLNRLLKCLLFHLAILLITQNFLFTVSLCALVQMIQYFEYPFSNSQ